MCLYIYNTEQTTQISTRKTKLLVGHITGEQCVEPNEAIAKPWEITANQYNGMKPSNEKREQAYAKNNSLVV